MVWLNDRLVGEWQLGGTIRVNRLRIIRHEALIPESSIWQDSKKTGFIYINYIGARNCLWYTILPYWNWQERVGEVTPKHVFTSGDEAELFVNGRSLGRKKKGQYEYRLSLQLK
jgi:hypothetical protein